MVSAADIPLETMDRKNLREVLARATALLGSETVAPTPGASDESREVFEAIRKELAEGGVTAPPFAAFQRLDDYSRFKRDVGTFMAYACKHFSPKTRAERLQLYCLLIRLIGWNLSNRERPIPVRLSTVLRQLPSIGAIVESQFPGYRESGLLPLVLSRQLTAGAV